MFELFKVLKVRSKSRVLYPFSSTPLSGTGNNSQGFLGLWGAKGTCSFVHAQGSIHTHIHALCFKDLPHNIRRLPLSKEIQNFLTNALMQTPGIHNDPDMNCFKWLWDGGGKKSSFGFKFTLSKYCSGTEKHKVYALSLSSKGQWFITTVNSICEHTHTHNPWHLFYWRPSAAWMKINLFEECFKHYPSVLTHKNTRSKKTESLPENRSLT